MAELDQLLEQKQALEDELDRVKSEIDAKKNAKILDKVAICLVNDFMRDYRGIDIMIQHTFNQIDDISVPFRNMMHKWFMNNGVEKYRRLIPMFEQFRIQGGANIMFERINPSLVNIDDEDVIIMIYAMLDLKISIQVQNVPGRDRTERYAVVHNY